MNKPTDAEVKLIIEELIQAQEAVRAFYRAYKKSEMPALEALKYAEQMAADIRKAFAGDE